MMTGSSIFAMSLGSGHLEGFSTSIDRPVGESDSVAHTGSGGDEVEVKLALQALLNNLHVKQAQEATAESETQSDRTLGLKEK